MASNENGPDDQVYQQASSGASLRQGEILGPCTLYRIQPESVSAATLASGEVKVQPFEFPYAIVVSQDCDLDRDFRNRTDEEGQDAQLLPNVLFLEAVDASVALAQDPELKPSKVKDFVRQNRHPRFHFLEAVAPAADSVGEGLPELVVDFRHYFAVSTDELYKRIDTAAGAVVRRSRLIQPYADQLSDRFVHYVGRVGTPRQFTSL